MTTWTFGGVQLEDFGVITLLDDHLDIAEKRGDDILVPLIDGRTFARKYFEQRAMMFGIVVYRDSIALLEDVLDEMKSLFGKRTQQTLSGTFWDGTVRSASAEVIGNLGLTRPRPSAALMTVNFRLTEPFMRSTIMAPRLAVSLTSNQISFDNATKEIRCTGGCGIFNAGGGETVYVSGASNPANNAAWTTASATANKIVLTASPTTEAAGNNITVCTHLIPGPIVQKINLSPTYYPIVNPGTAEECKPVIKLTGPLTNPKIINLTAANYYGGLFTGYVWVGYMSAILVGHYVVINCANFTAVDETGTNVVGNIVHSGAPSFMVFMPGNNSMRVEDDIATTGLVTVEFYPPYL